MTLWSWARVYGASMDAVVTPEAIPIINRLANLCIERFFDILTPQRTDPRFRSQFSEGE